MVSCGERVLTGVAVCLLAWIGFVGSAFGSRDREALSLGRLAPQRIVSDSRGRTLLLGRPGPSSTALARLTPHGARDPSFAEEGIVRLGFSVADIAIQGNGRIVAAGYGPRPGGSGMRMLVARLRDDGTLDASFGVGGIATVELGKPNEEALSIAVASGGKIVIGGSSGTLYSRFSADETAVARLEPDGALDPTFGDGGWVRFNIPNSFSAPARDVAILPSGGIVAAITREDGVLEVAQLGPRGALVQSRSRRSFAVEPPGFGQARGVSLEPLDQIGVLPSGRVVVVGTRRARSGGPASMVALRYLPGGRLDPSFGGGDGIFRSRLHNSAAAFAVQSSGRLAIAGGMNAAEGSFSVLCLDRRGRLDSRFGNGGVARTTFGLPGWQNRAGAVTFQGRRTVTVAGTATLRMPSSPYPRRTGVARLRMRPRVR